MKLLTVEPSGFLDSILKSTPPTPSMLVICGSADVEPSGHYKPFTETQKIINNRLHYAWYLGRNIINNSNDQTIYGFVESWSNYPIFMVCLQVKVLNEDDYRLDTLGYGVVKFNERLNSFYKLSLSNNRIFIFVDDLPSAWYEVFKYLPRDITLIRSHHEVK